MAELCGEYDARVYTVIRALLSLGTMGALALAWHSYDQATAPPRLAEPERPREFAYVVGEKALSPDESLRLVIVPHPIGKHFDMRCLLCVNKAFGSTQMVCPDGKQEQLERGGRSDEAPAVTRLRQAAWRSASQDPQAEERDAASHEGAEASHGAEEGRIHAGDDSNGRARQGVMTYACYYCRRPISTLIVDACRAGGVPVRCECRPGASTGSGDLGKGATFVVRDVRSSYACCDAQLSPNDRGFAICPRCERTYDLKGEWAPTLVIDLSSLQAQRMG